MNVLWLSILIFQLDASFIQVCQLILTLDQVQLLVAKDMALLVLDSSIQFALEIGKIPSAKPTLISKRNLR